MLFWRSVLFVIFVVRALRFIYVLFLPYGSSRLDLYEQLGKGVRCQTMTSFFFFSPVQQTASGIDHSVKYFFRVGN